MADETTKKLREAYRERTAPVQRARLESSCPTQLQIGSPASGALQQLKTRQDDQQARIDGLQELGNGTGLKLEELLEWSEGAEARIVKVSRATGGRFWLWVCFWGLCLSQLVLTILVVAFIVTHV